MAAPWERNWSTAKEEAAPWEREWATPTTPEPESRNLFYVANDTVIAIANMAASGVKSVADFVAPGNSFSKAVDEFVKKGEESQSDIVKAAREKYAQDMEEAKSFMEEVSATGKYLAGSPLQAAGMALGSFAGPGLAIKGVTKGAQVLNVSEKVASRLGLGTGVVTGAAMSGGDAAGSAYEMVMQTPDDILMQNDLIKSQVEAGRSLEEIKQEAATTAARRASVIPAFIGGVSGAFGVERILAGLGGKEAAKSLSAAAIKSGLTEAIQEGIEEGATEYSARAAAQTYDPRIDPMKGVAGAATMGAALGAIPGAAIGALDASRRIQADELQKSIEAARAAYEQETAAAETAAQEQAAKITQTAVPDETGKVAPSSFDISALDLTGTAVPAETIKPDVTTSVVSKENITDPVLLLVGDAYAEHGTTREVVKILKPKLEALGVPADQQQTIIAEARETLGIPKNDTKEGREANKIWRQQWKEAPSAKQPTETIAGAGELGAPSAVSELGAATTGAGAPVTTRVEPTGGTTELSTAGKGDQRPSLEEQYRSLPTEELITIYDDFLGDPREFQAAKAELIRRGEYAPVRIAELEEVLKNPNIESERRVLLETELNELKGEQGAESTPIEPTVTEPATDLGQPVVEAEEELTTEPAAEAVSATITEEDKGQGAPAVDKGVKKKGPSKEEYAATERVFSKEQMPFVTAKVRDRAGIPRTIDEAADFAAAETAFDFYDSAEKSVNQQLEKQAEAEGKTVEDLVAAIPDKQLFNMFYENVNTENLNSDRQDQINTRDAFIKTLPKDQQEAIRKKAIESFHAEIRAKKQAGKRTTEADKRKARQKLYDEAAAKRAKRKEQKATTEVKEAEKQTKKTEKEGGKEAITFDEQRNNTILKSLQTGDLSKILSAISNERNNDSVTAFFARKLFDIIREANKTSAKNTVNKLLTAWEKNTGKNYEDARKAVQKAEKIRRDLKPKETMPADVRAEELKAKEIITEYEAQKKELEASLEKGELSDLTIVVGKVEGNNAGKYDPATNTITIDPDNIGKQRLDIVVLHELTHYMADWAVDNPQNLSAEKRQALEQLKKLHNHVKSFLGDKYEIGSLKEFIAQGFSNPEFQLDMARLPPIQRVNLLKEFAKRIMNLLGFRDRLLDKPEKTELKDVYGATLGDVLSQIEIIISGPRSGVASGISYMSVPAGPVTDRSFDEMVNEMKSDKPIAFSTKAKEIAMTGKGREALVRVLQNDRIANERWQDRLMAQGRIIGYGLGFNNIYDQITLASGNADYIYKQYVQNIAQDIYDYVTDYANEYGVSTDRALNELGQFAIAKHYDERRKVLYLKTVPLSDAKIIPYKGQVNLSPAEVRTEIFKKLDKDEKLSEADIKALRSLLDKIVFDPSQKFLDNKNPDLLNITNTKYDVAGAYTDNEIATIMREYEARRPAVDKVLNKIKQLNKVNIDLNRQANYMSKFADNWIDFYGWENYIPFKGKGLSEEAQLLDLDSRKLGGELQEGQHAMEGRITSPDNPILQVMSDGALAALRVGRKDVTQAIYNAVDQGLIAGDKITLTFADRNNIKKLEEYRGESTIFHYMTDGNVAVIKLKDKAQREAIRRTYREVSPLIDKMNSITSVIGQQHTRYNVSFAPLNFVRDVLTNAFILGADLGPAKTFQYIGAVAAGVVRQQYKAAKFSWLYSNGKIDEIRALAMKDKSGYFRDMLEYVKTGGKVSYIAGIAPKGQYSEFMKASGGGKILTTKRQIDKFFDMWIDSFELTARVAAYRISKSTEKARLVSEGVSEADAEQGAKVAGAAYAKNLANFEQVGEWGKKLGAFYMFFRPSATGAVRAIKAISPALMNVKDAKTRLPEYAEMLNLRQQLKTEKVEGKKKEKMEARLAELEKAVSKFESTYAEKQKNARVMAISLIAMGYVMYVMSSNMADDDDLGRNKVATDDMARWTRNARFFIPGTDIIIQIPWGFGLGAFAALGAQLASLGNANTNFSDTVANMATIALDSFIPVPASRISAIDHPLQFTLDSILPSVARPLLELGMNMDALGRQIYNNRQSRFGEAYTGGDNIPEIYKNAARYWFDETGMDVGPGVLYFLANNYADGVSRLVQNSYNAALWMQGDKDFNAKTDMLIFDGFIGSKSNFDARQWQKVEDDLKDRQKIVNMLKENKPDRYAEYLAAHPLDQMLVDMYEKDVNGYLRDLRAQANKFRAMEGLSPKDRKAIVDSIVLQQNLEKFRLVQLYKAMDIEP